jgi:taurine dioxygenase
MHPETGRRSLYIGNPTETVPHFEGMSVAESAPLLSFLYEQSTTPDRVYRHRWQMGDVAMWDNRCTMHYAVHDYGDAVRRLYRCTIRGEPPVSL